MSTFDDSCTCVVESVDKLDGWEVRVVDRDKNCPQHGDAAVSRARYIPPINRPVGKDRRRN